jgi:hypothetical protein
MSPAQPATVDAKDQAPTGPAIRLNFARLYAQRGWAVFPVHIPLRGECTCRKPGCPNIGKHPWTAHGFTDATTDMEKIRVVVGI